MNLEQDLHLGLGVEPVNIAETVCGLGKSASPWQCDIETIMDNTFDYLMPTSMSRAKMSQSLPPFMWGNIFDQSLKALDSDTCSEISERSFVRSGPYDRIHQFRNSDFGKSPYDSDLEEYVLPWEHNFKIGESFDKSLQTFLDWPTSDPFDNVTLDIDDGFRIKKKHYSEKKRIKALKSRNVKSHLRAKRTFEEKLLQDGETADDESSDFFPRFHGSKSSVKKYFSPIDTSEKIEKTFKNYTLKPEMESDSDYKTYSDTSSDRITENGNDVDIDNLKGLMSAVYDKAEKVTKKLREIYVFDDKLRSCKQLTVRKKEGASSSNAQDERNRPFEVCSNPLNVNNSLQSINSKENSREQCKGIIQSSEPVHTRSECGTSAQVGPKLGKNANYNKQIFQANNISKNYDRDHKGTNSTYKLPTVVVTDHDSETDSDSESFVSFIQRLVRSLGKKEGELEGFKDLLKRAEESLSQSETAVEVCFHNLLVL